MRILILLVFSCLPIVAFSQPEVEQFTLQEIIQIAQNQSIAIRQAATLQTTRYWEWRSFQANLKPQLILQGNLPDFNRTFQEVVQPSGTIDFQSISNNNSRLALSLSQRISATGGILFVQSSLQRFDDFNLDKTLYNSSPVAIGLEQPLFRFNQLKWDKKIEPLKYEQSKQQYSYEREAIAVTAVDLFFNLLSAQINYQIAETNRINTDTLYAIAQERLKLGKTSRNDVLQLRLETLNARKGLASAKQDLESSTLRLRSFIGYQQVDKIELKRPDELPDLLVNPQQALHEAFANRPDATGFRRQLLEAERDVAEAKGNTGFQAALYGSFGLTNRGNQLDDLVKSPKDQETVLLQFSFPILDWGRAKSQIETALANQQLAQFTVEQDKLNFEQEILTQVSLLESYRTQVDLTAQADAIASERYQIAQERFMLGDLSITDLTIALQEKDRAKRDYVLALWDFWSAYYNLRKLTLYDFTTGKKLNTAY